MPPTIVAPTPLSYAGDMAQIPPPEDDANDKRRTPDLSASEVDEAFSEIAAQIEGEGLGGPRDYSPTEEDDRFIPPDPGPVTSTDVFLTLGWGLLAGGLLVVLASLIFWPSAPRIFHLACVGTAMVGGAILVWRMPHHKDDDDDLGAVV